MVTFHTDGEDGKAAEIAAYKAGRDLAGLASWRESVYAC